MLQFIAYILLGYIAMNVLPHQILRNVRGRNLGQAARRNNESAQDVFKDETFHPTPLDIYVVRAMLAKAKLLPPDIVDMIFEHAEYWAHSSNEVDYLAEHQSPLRVTGSSQAENKFLLRSYPVGLTGAREGKELAEELAWDMTEAQPLPLGNEHEPEYFKRLVKYPTPKLVSPVRKVVFSIRSRDQGWGGTRPEQGTFKSSWTWFEAGLERFDADQTCDPQCPYDVRHRSTSSTASPLPVCGLRAVYPGTEPDPEHADKLRYTHPLNANPKYEIQRNKTATKQYQNHVVTWSHLDDVSSQSDEAMKMDEEHGRGRETLDGSFVRDLKLGDVVTVWAKARFPGWINHVEKVKIDIYWAV